MFAVAHIPCHENKKMIYVVVNYFIGKIRIENQPNYHEPNQIIIKSCEPIINTYTFFYFKADNGVSRWMGNAVGYIIPLFTCFLKKLSLYKSHIGFIYI